MIFFAKTNLNQSLRIKYWQKGKLSVRIVAKVHFYLKVGTTKCNKANARIEQVFSNAEYAAKNIIYYNFFRCRALFFVCREYIKRETCCKERKLVLKAHKNFAFKAAKVGGKYLNGR